MSVPMIIDTDPGVCDHGPDRGSIVADSGADGRAVQVALDADLPSINATILDRLRDLR